MESVDSLIEDAFAGRSLTADEAQAITEHIAKVGFDPTYRVAAGGQAIGLEWQGKVLTARTRVLSGEQHYLKHVRIQHEWPRDTTIQDYFRDGARLAREHSAGIFVNYRAGRPKIGIIGRTPSTSRGPSGHTWTLLEYHVKARHWVTLFQPEHGKDYVLRDSK